MTTVIILLFLSLVVSLATKYPKIHDKNKTNTVIKKYKIIEQITLAKLGFPFIKYIISVGIITMLVYNNPIKYTPINLETIIFLTGIGIEINKMQSAIKENNKEQFAQSIDLIKFYLKGYQHVIGISIQNIF